MSTPVEPLENLDGCACCGRMFFGRAITDHLCRTCLAEHARRHDSLRARAEAAERHAETLTADITRLEDRWGSALLERDAAIELLRGARLHDAGNLMHTYPPYVLKPGEQRTEWTPDIAEGPHPTRCLACRIDAFLAALDNEVTP